MVELQLDAVEDAGMPKDCYISVRVGETQKLSKLSAARLYRFPQAGDRRYGKIEVFRRIGYCSIDVDPTNIGQREVAVDCQDAGFGHLGLKVAVKAEDGAAPAKKPSRADGTSGKVKAAKDYLSRHGLEVRLSEAMQAVLREQPEDPMEFMAAKLVNSSNTNIGGLKLPSMQRSQPQETSPPMPAAPKWREEPVPVPPPARPFKKAPHRPHKLEALHRPPGEAEAEALAPPPKAVAPRKDEALPFSAFYAANFRSMGTGSFTRLHSKFMGKQPAAAEAKAPAAAPTEQAGSFRLLPSVATWMRPLAKGKGAAAGPVATPLELYPKNSSGLQIKPSVASWIRPLPRRQRLALAATAKADGQAAAAAPVAPAAGAGFALRPSVGTWLAPRPVAVKLPKPVYGKAPSVGTWLAFRLVDPVEPEKAAAAQPAAPAAAAPAVVTVVAEPFTGAAPYLQPVSGGPMFLAPQAFLGPSFASCNIGPGSLLFI